MNNIIDLLDKENPKVLMKNNVLIHASYSLSLNENRIFLLMLYKLQRSYDESMQSMQCEINYNEIKQIIKKTNDRTAKKIAQTLSGLMKKSIFFMEKKQNEKKIVGESVIVSVYKYDEEKQSFIIKSPVEIYELLGKYIQTGYTPTNLAILFSLKNYYAQRLYELLRVWSGTKHRINYKVEDIKTSLMIEKLYPRYSDFKKRVLVPAINALNETGYFEIDFEEKKEGKKVTSIDFIVVDLDTRTYYGKDIIKDIDFKLLDENDSDFELPIESNEDNKKDKLSKASTKNSLEEISTNIPKTKEKSAKGEFFVPDEEVFTRGTLRLFKKDFKNYDFREKENLQAFERAVAITLEKDDVDVIKTASYDYFKSTCFNIIADYVMEKESEKKHEEEMNEYWHNNKTNYMSIDEEREPVDENIRKKLFDAGLVNEDGYYYK